MIYYYPEFYLRLKMPRFSCVLAGFVEKTTFLLGNTMFSCFSKFCGKKTRNVEKKVLAEKTRFSQLL